MIAEIGSSVSQISQRLKSLADYDNDLAKADDSLINEQARTSSPVCALELAV